MPEVSIVIPCYKGERYLAEAIESCLAQTLQDFEILVVDDCSPDRCAEIAEAYAARDPRVRVLRHAVNRGISAAWNTGYSAACGRYFTRLAQDDRFREDALELMVGALRAHPEVGMVYCNVMLIDEEGKEIHPLIVEPPERALIPCCRVSLCVMWPRHVWEAVGYFDSCCDTAEDYDYWLRISRRFPLHKCGDEIPFYFRYHAAQGSIRSENRQKAAAQLALFRYWRAELGARPASLLAWKRAATTGVRLASWRLRGVLGGGGR